MATARILSGPQSSARNHAVLVALVKQWGRALLLVPSRECARDTQRVLLKDFDIPAILGQPVMTFQDFVDHIRADAAESPGRMVSEYERRMLVEQALAKAVAQSGPEAEGLALHTPGIVSHVQRLIAELKQVAVEPEEFRQRAMQRKHPSPLDNILAAAYAAYQDMLKEVGRYDRQGIYWYATEVCSAKKPRVLEGIDTVLLDGFDDFTPSEFRLLEEIQPHINALVFGMNINDHPARRDVYEVPVRTRETIRIRFGATETCYEPQAPEDQVSFAAAHVFSHDDIAAPQELRANMTLVACSNPQSELEWIGRRIKTLLVGEGVAPDRIFVGLRNPAAARQPLAALFSEYGIPFSLDEATPLSDSSLGVHLLAVLEETRQWDRLAVLPVLTSPWLTRTQPPVHASSYPEISRHAKILSGLAEWRARLTALSRSLAEDSATSPLGKHHPNAAAATCELTNRVEALAEAISRLPKEGAIQAYAAWIEDYLAHIRLEEALETIADEETRAIEEAAFNALRHLSRSLGQWDTLGTGPSGRDDFLRTLRLAMSETSLPTPSQGRSVRCASLERMRLSQCDHLFLARFNERQFPCPRPTNALYGERDIHDFQDAGIPLEARQKHLHREMLLLQHALDCAKLSCTFSWHITGDDNRDTLPSPYLEDLRRLFVSAPLRELSPLEESGSTPGADSSCLREAAITLCANKAAMGHPDFTTACRGIEIVRARETTELGPFDGMVTNADLLEHLREHYDEDHVFSATRLETYRSCPFRYFLEHQLHCKETRDPSPEFDPLVRGSILHEILEDFHRAYQNIPGPALPPEADAHMDAIVEVVFQRRQYRDISASPGATLVEKSRIRNICARYLESVREDKKSEHAGWKPAYFEVSFGNPRGGRVDPVASVEEPFIFEAEGRAIRLAGRIDRIDTDGDRMRLIDYKSGGTPAPKEMKIGVNLQLGLYASVLENHLFEGKHVCAQVGYLGLAKKDDLRNALELGKDQDARAIAMRAAGEAVKGISGGIFTPTHAAKPCSYCPQARPCRFNSARHGGVEDESEGEE